MFLRILNIVNILDSLVIDRTDRYVFFRISSDSVLTFICYCVFTRITRPLVKYWRRQGLNVFICIEDGLVFCPTHAQALRMSAQVRTSNAPVF
jgi:hypothetical protein